MCCRRPPLHPLRLQSRPAPGIVVPLVRIVGQLAEIVDALAVPLRHHADGEVAHVRLDPGLREHVERLVELDRDVGVAWHVEGRAVAGGVILERVEGEEVDRQRPARDREPGDVDVLRDRLQAEHGVEAERDADLDAVAECLRLLHRPARQADDLVVGRAETLHADQQVADAGLLQPLALLPLGEGDRVGDQGGEQADLVTVRDQLLDVPPDRRLAALDVDRCVAVPVAQVVADGLRLLEIHEGMLGVVLLLDAVEEVAEVATDVAGLPEPHHAASREQLVAGLEVARRRRRPLTRSTSRRNLGGQMLASAGACVPTHRIPAPTGWSRSGQLAYPSARSFSRKAGSRPSCAGAGGAVLANSASWRCRAGPSPVSSGRGACSPGSLPRSYSSQLSRAGAWMSFQGGRRIVTRSTRTPLLATPSVSEMAARSGPSTSRLRPVRSAGTSKPSSAARVGKRSIPWTWSVRRPGRMPGPAITSGTCSSSS